MDYIIFDLEATCWEKNTPGVTQEIIEIGALRLGPTGQEYDSFHRMVRPVMHPRLSPYCRRLTNIDQSEVDQADSFPQVHSKFEEWLFESDEFALVSWGGVDRRLLRQDCRMHQLDHEWLDYHVNLKQLYQELFRLPSRIGLAAAVRREGLTFEGDAHRAMTDARNLRDVFLRHIDMWPIP